MTYGNGGNQLPVSPDEILKNMRAAVPARRGAGSTAFFHLEHKTGDLTFGRDKIPLPPHRFVIPWREVAWGCKCFAGRTVTEAVMRPVAAGARPMPPGDYSPYGVDGWRECMELRACSLDEPGFGGIYSCLNPSGTSRMLDLWGDIAAQYSINAAFANPVVLLVPDFYTNSYGTTWVLTYPIKDWLADDGATLLSTVGGQPKVEGGAEAAELPF